MGERRGRSDQIAEEEGSSASGQRMTVFQRGNRSGARRKDGGEPYELAGISPVGYKNTIKKFLGEDDRKVREKTAKHEWGLVLGNLPKEKVGEETTVSSLRRKKTEEEERVAMAGAGSTEEPKESENE